MCKSHEYNRIGDFYKPFDDIFQLLKSPWTTNADSRMTKLWADFIGKKVIIDTTAVKSKGNLIQKVSDIFTFDPIAYRLMEELVLYRQNVDSIIVREGSNDNSGMIQFMETAKQPVPVFECSSKYAAIISTDLENENVLHLNFWELSNSKAPNIHTSCAKDIWAESNNDNSVVEATHSTQNSSKIGDLYKPFNDIVQLLKSPGSEKADSRMTKLWINFLGEKVIINTAAVENKDNLIQRVCDMFTFDPIAYRLMAELVLYKRNFDAIIVCEDSNNSSGMIEFLKTAKHPVPVFECSSKYATIICTDIKNENILHLNFWELSHSKAPNIQTSSAEDIWAEFSRDKLVIEATNSTRKANIRKMLNSQVCNAAFVSCVTQYASSVDRITVKQNFESTKVDKQSLSEMVTLLKTAVNPKIMFVDDLAIVISTNNADSKNVFINIWDLKISI